MTLHDEQTFTTYVSLVSVEEPNVQNVQEFSTVWGEIRQELAERDVHIEQSYAVLGRFDFLVVLEAPSTDAAFEADVVLERHGLDVETMAVTETDHFAELVDDT
ncbi:MAG: GYD domain-containing protein [Haloferacaceae archaeon]